jgi:hypothetical protein
MDHSMEMAFFSIHLVSFWLLPAKSKERAAFISEACNTMGLKDFYIKLA